MATKINKNPQSVRASKTQSADPGKVTKKEPRRPAGSITTRGNNRAFRKLDRQEAENARRISQGKKPHKNAQWIGRISNFDPIVIANKTGEADLNYRHNKGREITNYGSESAGNSRGRVPVNDPSKKASRNHVSAHRSTAKVAAGGWDAVHFMDKKYQGTRYGNWAELAKKAGLDSKVSATRLITILQDMGMDTEGLDHKHGKKFRQINGAERDNWSKVHTMWKPGQRRILGKGLNADGTLTKDMIEVLKQFHAAVRQNVSDQNELDGILKKYIANQHGKRTHPDGTVTRYHTRPAGGLILGKKGH